MSLRVFGAVRASRRSAAVPEAGSEQLEELVWQRRPDESARASDDFAWFAETAGGGGFDLDAEPPWLEWRAPPSAELIRWRPPESTPR